MHEVIMNLTSENIDIEAEKAVIASLLNEGGYKVWLEISDILNNQAFIADTHNLVYRCVDHLFKKHTDIDKVQQPLLSSTAKELGFGDFFDNKEEKKYLKEISSLSVDQSNVRPLAVRLRKLEVVRLIRESIKSADTQYNKITGDEKLVDLYNIIENRVSNLAQLIHGLDVKGPQPLFSGLRAYVEGRLANPIKVIGLSSGWDEYDKAIGGGLRAGTVNVIASRFGEGKTSVGENIGYNVANQNIRVLLLDTEMSEEERWPRDCAMVSGVSISEIERGDYGNNAEKVRKVREAMDKLEKCNYDYQNISGMEFDQVVAIMKHWIMTKVGLNSEGVANPCLIILDYLKIQSGTSITHNIAEYQALGLLTTAFVNFCQKYKVAGLTFAQVNREGLTSEESNIIAGSDRISWFASSVAFMKSQSEEEIGKQKEKGITDLYDKKLIILKARHGPGLDRDNYIHLRFRRYFCKMECGPTNWDLGKDLQVAGQSGEIVVDGTETIF